MTGPADDGDLLLGIGMAAGLDCDRVLRLRDFHPSAHAGFQLLVHVEDGVVQRADPRVGLMHRGAEKLFESRDYRQIMMLANRHDWLSAFSSELGVALAVEAATGITPPERATWSRTLLAEANRVSASLAFIGSTVTDRMVGRELLLAREDLVDAQERATGGRVHPMFTRIGGLSAPIPESARDRYADLVERLRSRLAAAAPAMDAHAASVAGLAVLDRDVAIGFGVSGPVGRASGLDLDLRRDDPYLAYPQVADLLAVPIRSAGDARARYEVLAAQLPVSLDLMTACLERLRELGEGPIDVRLPKTVRAPESVTHSWLEGPLGISGVLLASVGDTMPWRLKVRSASFNNVQAMGTALVGVPVERLADAVMSFFLVVGDIDR